MKKGKTDLAAALHQAIVDGDAAAVKEIIAGGGSIREEFRLDKNSRLLANLRPQLRERLAEGYLDRIFPLHLAAITGQAEIAEILISAGASVKQPNVGWGFCPLHYASVGDAVEVARVLIRHGASIEKQSVFKLRPLHNACYFGSGEMIRFLVLSGAKWDVKGMEEAYTPLAFCNDASREILLAAIREREEMEWVKWRKKHRALGRLRPGGPSL